VCAWVIPPLHDHLVLQITRVCRRPSWKREMRHVHCMDAVRQNQCKRSGRCIVSFEQIKRVPRSPHRFKPYPCHMIAPLHRRGTSSRDRHQSFTSPTSLRSSLFAASVLRNCSNHDNLGVVNLGRKPTTLSEIRPGRNGLLDRVLPHIQNSYVTPAMATSS
jgi:hypothetical protein